MLIANFLAADDGDRLRRFHQRCIGFGSGQGAFGDITIDWTSRILSSLDIARAHRRLIRHADGARGSLSAATLPIPLHAAWAWKAQMWHDVIPVR